MDGYKLRSFPIEKVCKWIWEAAVTAWGTEEEIKVNYQEFEDFLLLTVGLRHEDTRKQYMRAMRLLGYITFPDHDGKNRPGSPRRVTVHKEPKLNPANPASNRVDFGPSSTPV